MKVDQMASRAEEQNIALAASVHDELERGLLSLEEEICNGFQTVHAKLDRINQKLNRIHGVSKLNKLAADAKDAEQSSELVDNISRGEIVEVEGNLLDSAYELLDGAKDQQDWREGLLQTSYLLTAYHLEVAWLLAKNPKKKPILLPERLDEGARRLGGLIGRYIAAIGTREYDSSQMQSLLTLAATLSNDYALLFAPAVIETQAGQNSCSAEDVQETHPRRSCAEAFLGIGDLSLGQNDGRAAQRAYHIALAFDPFYDATWIRVQGRLRINELRTSMRLAKDDGDFSLRPERCEDVDGLSSAILAIQKYAVDLEMSKHSMALASTVEDKQETVFEGSQLFADVCKLLLESAAGPESASLDSLILVAAGLIGAIAELFESDSPASRLVFENLLNLIPVACSSNRTAGRYYHCVRSNSRDGPSRQRPLRRFAHEDYF